MAQPPINPKVLAALKAVAAAKRKPIVVTNPTTQDSVDILNNTLALEKYFANKNYKLTSKDKEVYDKNSTIGKKLDEDYEYFLKKPNITIPNKNSDGVEILSGQAAKDLYRKVKDKNQLYQREEASTVLDTKSPMALYDRRISPQFSSKYENVNQADPLFGDVVRISTYDPIAVKPISMMTPQERAIRAAKYPEPNPKPSPPVTPPPVVQRTPVVVPAKIPIKLAPTNFTQPLPATPAPQPVAVAQPVQPAPPNKPDSLWAPGQRYSIKDEKVRRMLKAIQSLKRQ